MSAAESNTEVSATAAAPSGAPSTGSTPIGEDRPPSHASGAAGQGVSSMEQEMSRLRVDRGDEGAVQTSQALPQMRHFTAPSMVTIDPTYPSPNAFGLSFDGAAQFAPPPFPASEHPLPPPPPPYDPQHLQGGSNAAFAPIMVFTSMPYPYAEPHQFVGFGGSFSPPQSGPLGQFGYHPSPQYLQQYHSQHPASYAHQQVQQEAQAPSPSRRASQQSSSSASTAQPVRPLAPPSLSTPPPAASSAGEAFSTPPKPIVSSDSWSQTGPPSAQATPRKQMAPDTREQPKPCDVWTCFKPVFCELAPCGCRICRDHLGSVIRGAKVVEPEVKEGDGLPKSKEKVFECVACQARSRTAGPAKPDSPNLAPSEVNSEAGPSNLKEFSIHYPLSHPHTYASPSTPSPTVSARPEVMPSTLVVDSPSISSLQESSAQQQAHPQVAQQQYVSSTYFGAAPRGRDFPLHHDPFLPQQPAFGGVDQPPHFNLSPPQQRALPLAPPPSIPIDPSQALSAAPRVHPDRRVRSFTVPSQPAPPSRPRASPPRAGTGANASQIGVGHGGGRWVTGGSSQAPVKHLSADFGAGGASATQRWMDPRGPKTDPSEPYQLSKPLYPVIKVENIPFSTTVADIEQWLPARCLPHTDNVITSIHLILHRATGRTLPHCYLEMANLQIANDLIVAMDRKQLGDRTVRLKHERRGELMRDLFSQEGYFAIAAPSPAAAPLPPAPTKFVLPQTIISDTDLKQLRAFCQRSLVPYKERPAERAFLNIVSIIAKFPWAERQLWTEQTRDAIFECALTATEIAVKNSVAEPSIFPSLVKKLRAIVLDCIGFTEAQKDAIRSMVAAEPAPLTIDEKGLATWQGSALELDLGSALPPSTPNQSRRASQVSAGQGFAGTYSPAHPLSSLPARPLSPPASPVFPPLPRGQNTPSRSDAAPHQPVPGVWGRSNMPVTKLSENDPSSSEAIAELHLSR